MKEVCLARSDLLEQLLEPVDAEVLGGSVVLTHWQLVVLLVQVLVAASLHLSAVFVPLLVRLDGTQCINWLCQERS